MDFTQAKDEYLRALKMAQKEQRELAARGLNENPAVLDDILDGDLSMTVVDVGLVNIPTERIVGTKSAGRISAFTPSFMPLINVDSEFASKWIALCMAHLKEGIRDPVLCYEYLGNFYVQEGNKRVSVLRYFGAPTITGTVKRILPPRSDDPQILAYYEFLEFYEGSKLYDIRFRRPGDYARLLSFLGKEPGELWTETDRRTFRSGFYYFREAFHAVGGQELDLLPGEALLLWLQVNPFRDLLEQSSDEVKKSVRALKEDMQALAQDEPVQVQTLPNTEGKTGILGLLLNSLPDHLNIAFIHPKDPVTSAWVTGHEQGIAYLRAMFGERITVTRYFIADNPEAADALLEQAVREGAQVVFTTAPQLNRATLKAAVQYPKVRFLNCSVDQPYSSVRTYYSRIFEGKFITGAIAGAMSDNNNIGYVGTYPIFGVPASINAFALGAQLTNPRAKIQLRWSCVEGQPVSDFIRQGIKVISNRDVPTPDKNILAYCDYGTYMVADGGELIPLASPCWLWGKFYEHVIQSVFKGGWNADGTTGQAVNYWWGMDSGVIDVTFSDRIPEGVLAMARILRDGLRKGTIDPFKRRIVAQDGSVKNPGQRGFSPEELLHMDWLCENIEGSIPGFEEILPMSQAMVRELGIYRDHIPMEKEGSL